MWTILVSIVVAALVAAVVATVVAKHVIEADKAPKRHKRERGSVYGW